MAAKKLILAASIVLLLPLAAQAATEPIVVPSDTATEWFDGATNTWNPAAITLPHPSWPPLSGSHWIWSIREATLEQRQQGATIEFRRKFALPEARTGTLYITADNEVTARLNGAEVAHTTCDFSNAPACILSFPIEGTAGDNEFTFTVTNYAKPSADETQNPAGFIYQAVFDEVVEGEEVEPVVLIPGMTASLNTRRIFANESGGKWDFGPGARRFYQALIDQFAQHNFQENKNLFIAHYDWRNPVPAAAANYLKPVIDEAKQKTGADKVDIVAHSMGGLVARSYIQSDSYGNDVDQLVTLGTPHLGASDAYVAWEGGDLPDRWSIIARIYLTMIERSLSSLSLNPAKPRPLSLREFFPSLKDILPINDFVTRNNTPFSIGQHIEQNPFLQQLITDLDVIEQRGVRVTTIGGNGVNTLNQVLLNGTRTNEDIARQRWRDGHPNPDPPTTDTTLGDQTVLLSSALFGTSSLTLNNAKHDKLPEEAQEEVLEALGLESSGPHIAYNTPDSLMGTVVLSPIIPSITLPDGTTFVCDATKQAGNIECVVDEEDMSGPKLLIVLDPDVGDYKITLTGTSSGPYHAITCFADSDQDGCTAREGTTTSGKVETYQVHVGEEDFTAPPEDILTLADELRQAVSRLYKDKHLTTKAFTSLLTPAATMAGHAKAYQALAAKLGFEHAATARQFDALKQQFQKFTSALNQHVQQGHVDDAAILELTALRDQITDAGI